MRHQAVVLEVGGVMKIRSLDDADDFFEGADDERRVGRILSKFV